MKVAIKLPDTIKDVVQTFPLLHAIRKLLVKNCENEVIDDFQIHFICVEEALPILNLLPFNAFYHELKMEDLKNVFAIHRAIKVAKIDFIDVFISTTKSFVDASIGKNLNAQVRGGFAIGKNKVFLNKTCSYLEGQHQSDIYFNLINILEESSTAAITNVGARDLEPVIADSKELPYFVINLKLNEEHELEANWKDFFDLFEKKRFVFCSESVSPEEHDIIVSKIAAGLNSKNSYEVFNPLDKIKFGKLVAHSQAFITYDSDLLYIAAYCGTNCYWLNETINASTEGPEYFYCDVIKRYGLKEPIFKMADQEGINLSPIFDDIYTVICKNDESENAAD